MLPPEVAPECAASSVGVVSNFSQHNVVVANDKAIVLPCDADTVKERVAQAFADAGVMDRVVVLDSLLYHPDSTVQHVLTQGEVNALCRKLNVEMIYSIDYACLVYNPTERDYGDRGIPHPHTLRMGDVLFDTFFFPFLAK